MKKMVKSIIAMVTICLVSFLLISISVAPFAHAEGSVRHPTVRPTRRPPSTARVGRRFTMLPRGSKAVVVRGNDYYYNDGVFYQPDSGGYVVVFAPIGAVIPRQPKGSVMVEMGNDIYYYYNGAYYFAGLGGLAVVEAPVGATVPYLPAGYHTVYVRGARHYEYGGAQYRPYSYRGRVVYRVVTP